MMQRRSRTAKSVSSSAPSPASSSAGSCSSSSLEAGGLGRLVEAQYCAPAELRVSSPNRRMRMHENHARTLVGGGVAMTEQDHHHRQVVLELPHAAQVNGYMHLHYVERSFGGEWREPHDLLATSGMMGRLPGTGEGGAWGPREEARRKQGAPPKGGAKAAPVASNAETDSAEALLSISAASTMSYDNERSKVPQRRGSMGSAIEEKTKPVATTSVRKSKPRTVEGKRQQSGSKLSFRGRRPDPVFIKKRYATNSLAVKGKASGNSPKRVPRRGSSGDSPVRRDTGGGRHLDVAENVSPW